MPVPADAPQVKEVAKAKTKPKDAAGLLVTEACTLAQASVDGGEDVPPDMLARLLKIKFTAHREEVLEHRAVEARAREQQQIQEVGATARRLKLTMLAGAAR